MKEQKPQTKAFHFCDYCANKAVELVEQARADEQKKCKAFLSSALLAERAKTLQDVQKQIFNNEIFCLGNLISWLKAELKKGDGKCQ